MKLQELQSSSENQMNFDIDYPKQIIWRRNAPYFYQVLYTQQNDWPSFTIQWRPDPELNIDRRNKSEPQYLTYIAYSMNTDHQTNTLIFGKVYIPNQDFLQKKYKQRPPSKNDSIKKNQEPVKPKIEIKYQVDHPGEINRIRYNPIKTHLIASRTSKGNILVIDQQKYIKGKSQLKPHLVLKGHEGEGFAIEWNRKNYWLLAGGSYNGKLSVWDTLHKTAQNSIAPMVDFIYHKHEIQDVSWNHFHDSIFASCDDGGFTAFWDLRTSTKPIHTMKNHEGAIYSLEFSPLNEYTWASGGEDTMAKVWDVRNVKESLFEWKTGQNLISNMRWSSDDRTLLWTVNQKLITAWDVCEQSAKFVHGGHLKRVTEMAVHPNLSDVFASADDDNSIHIFQPNKNYK